MGWHEWPLMVFTVLGQISVGGFVVLALALIRNKPQQDERAVAVRPMLVIWVLLGIAFIASTFHLGSPFKAIHALNRVAASGLSTEVACGMLFFAAGGLYWLLSSMKKVPEGLHNIWLAVAAVIGVLFVYTMVNAYKIPTIPTWDNGYTTVNFFMTMLIGGSLLGYLLMKGGICNCSCAGKVLTIVAVVAFIVSIASNLMQGSELATIVTSTVSAATLVPNYGQLMAMRMVLVALGLAIWIIPMLKDKRASDVMLVGALALIIFGELIGRGVFYGLHMTVGVTYGG